MSAAEKEIGDAEKLEAGTTTVNTELVTRLDEEFKLTIGKILAMASLLCGYLAAVFCIQMTSAVLTTINADIGPSPSFAWIATSQVIPVGVFGPMVGRLSDIFGRRDFILVGNILGLIGCAVSATAGHVNVVIGGGIFIGVASACQQLAWSGLGEMVPNKYRGLAIGIFELFCVAPGAFGPIIGNAIAATSTWRWVYWVPFILNCLAFVLVFLFYRPKNQYIREEGKTRLQEIVDLDWIGLFLCGTGLCLFLLGISFGGNQLAWKSAGTIVMIVVGLLFLVILGFYEAFRDQVFPLFPPIVFRKIRGVTLVLIGTFLFGMLYYSTAVLWPQQVQALYTRDLIKIGWYASSLGMAGIISSPIFGFLFTLGHARLLFIFIIAIGTIASGCMAVVSPGSNIASTVLVALEGVSVGGGMIVATAMVQLAVDHEYIGIATALAVTARNVGGAVGTVIYTSIFSDRLKFYIKEFVAIPLLGSGVNPAKLEGVIMALTGQAPRSALSALTPQQLGIALEGVEQSFSHALRIVYLSSIAFGVVGTVCVLFCKNVDDRMTKKVEIKLDEGAKIHGNTDTGEGHIIRLEEQELHRHGPHSHNMQSNPRRSNV
ncbi:trichothecene efflux pump [Lepidopterella palustris CBS 459.81]|uniref:Trichothecene efflux pump n=1 Tax=Lepidopterella palustris CBS 459.81 TaxID=1314670 RepID=A0A8E2DXP8_9PEZI|nr:trichothecene efflux pump [Lepidopterella palustris CBS 459.81]